MTKKKVAYALSVGTLDGIFSYTSIAVEYLLLRQLSFLVSFEEAKLENLKLCLFLFLDTTDIVLGLEHEQPLQKQI